MSPVEIARLRNKAQALRLGIAATHRAAADHRARADEMDRDAAEGALRLEDIERRLAALEGGAQ